MTEGVKRVSVRFPDPALHARLVEDARDQGRSVNNHLLHLVAASLPPETAPVGAHIEPAPDDGEPVGVYRCLHCGTQAPTWRPEWIVEDRSTTGGGKIRYVACFPHRGVTLPDENRSATPETSEEPQT